jgi:transcriptional regulator of met regulon
LTVAYPGGRVLEIAAADRTCSVVHTGTNAVSSRLLLNAFVARLYAQRAALAGQPAP